MANGLQRLLGAAHPAVYRVTYRCSCGSDHVGLVSHDDLDYRPIGGSTELEFRNLLTGRLEPVRDDETESRELFQSETAQKYVVQIKRVEKMRQTQAV